MEIETGISSVAGRGKTSAPRAPRAQREPRESRESRVTRAPLAYSRRFWVFAIATVIAVCSVAAVSLAHRTTPRNPVARVYKDGELIREIDLGSLASTGASDASIAANSTDAPNAPNATNAPNAPNAPNTPNTPDAKGQKIGNGARFLTVGAEPLETFDGTSDEIYAAGGEANTIEFESGRARVIKASCPDKVCVEQGWISGGGAPIACLPNALVIEITEFAAEGESGASSEPGVSGESGALSEPGALGESDEAAPPRANGGFGVTDAVSR